MGIRLQRAVLAGPVDHAALIRHRASICVVAPPSERLIFYWCAEDASLFASSSKPSVCHPQKYERAQHPFHWEQHNGSSGSIRYRAHALSTKLRHAGFFPVQRHNNTIYADNIRNASRLRASGIYAPVIEAKRSPRPRYSAAPPL